METESLTVNGHPADAGCYVEGHHGQYGPDHLADRLEGFGIVIARSDDPRWWRKVGDRMGEIAQTRGEYVRGFETWGNAAHRTATAWEAHSECASDLIEQANAVTTGGYWEWWEGEVFLRSYVCGQCGADARERYYSTDGTGTLTNVLGSEPCDYCCDADDPGVYA